MTHKKLLKYVIESIIYISLTLTVFLLIMFLTNEGPNIISSQNGTLASGIILVGISLFIFLLNFGAFDYITYGVMFIPSMFRRDMDRKYKDLYEYRESKSLKRKYNKWDFLLPLIISIMYFIATIVLYVIYKKSF